MRRIIRPAIPSGLKPARLFKPMFRMSKRTMTATPLGTIQEAVEIVDQYPGAYSPVLVTCEHATDRLPQGWKWPAADSRLFGTHWSYDPGAADFSRELAKHLRCPALLSRFSRLLIDPNRPLNSSTLIRTVADDETVQLNSLHVENAHQSFSPAAVGAAEDRKARIELYYKPYHQALHRILKARPWTRLLLSIHSFTPEYEGQPRQVEIGVLHHDSDKLAKPMQEQFSSAGYDARLNEPWSGKEGFMYAVQSVARPGRNAVMLEFRQDLVVEESWRRDVIGNLVNALKRTGQV